MSGSALVARWTEGEALVAGEAGDGLQAEHDRLREVDVHAEPACQRGKQRKAGHCRRSVHYIVPKVLSDIVTPGPKHDELVNDVGVGDRQYVAEDGDDEIVHAG